MEIGSGFFEEPDIQLSFGGRRIQGFNVRRERADWEERAVGNVGRTEDEECYQAGTPAEESHVPECPPCLHRPVKN